ncbi:MAG TPA: DUF1772 domain-containing protein [Steroidobacteraceae bacterium]|jgi:hypothetical protein|nr:DUF1772 domain-containing protein [Steroidobacteraceae bacterium]
MLLALKFIATLTAATFAGAALYVNLVEHPARMTLDTRAAVLEWAPAYARGTWMQAPLAVLSFLAGLGSWWRGGGVGWALAAVLIGAVVPFTFLVIMPTNRALHAPGLDLASTETRALLERWAKLHAVRTVLSLAATLLYVFLALTPGV